MMMVVQGNRVGFDCDLRFERGDDGFQVAVVQMYDKRDVTPEGHVLAPPVLAVFAGVEGDMRVAMRCPYPNDLNSKVRKVFAHM